MLQFWSELFFQTFQILLSWTGIKTHLIPGNDEHPQVLLVHKIFVIAKLLIQTCDWQKEREEWKRFCVLCCLAHHCSVVTGSDDKHFIFKKTKRPQLCNPTQFCVSPAAAGYVWREEFLWWKLPQEKCFLCNDCLYFWSCCLVLIWILVSSKQEPKNDAVGVFCTCKAFPRRRTDSLKTCFHGWLEIWSFI